MVTLVQNRTNKKLQFGIVWRCQPKPYSLSRAGAIPWYRWPVVFRKLCLCGKYPELLRRVVVWDEKNRRTVDLLTNVFHLAASTVGAVYKERWQIELFFKALKQNLKIKTFVGTSENAVQIQIWTALIAMLLLKYMQLKSSWDWSLSNLAAMLRMNLLTYRDLWAWLNDPFAVRATGPPVRQMLLFA